MEFEIDQATDPVLQQVALPEGLDGFTSHSPAALKKKYTELAQRKEALV